MIFARGVLLSHRNRPKCQWFGTTMTPASLIIHDIVNSVYYYKKMDVIKLPV